MNQVVLCGYVGRDPEVKQLKDGRQVATWSLATSERYRDAEGNKQERTDWHDLVAWGGTAKIVADYVAKGSRILVSGKLQRESWTDKDGGTRSRVRVLVLHVELLSKAGSVERTGSDGYGSDPGPSDDDIPF